MNASVHGKSSLAEMLMADVATAEKRGADDRDKTNTVDFGATLMSLVDPGAVTPHALLDSTPDDALASSSATDANSSRHRAAADSRWRDDVTSRWSFDDADASSDEGTEALADQPAASTAKTELTSHRTISFARYLDDQQEADRREAVATTPTPNAATERTANASRDLDIPTMATPAATTLDDTIETPVPDRDIMAEIRKQPFAVTPSDDAADITSVTPGASKESFANAVNPAPSDAPTDQAASVKPHPVAPDASRNPRPDDGTSPALTSSFAAVTMKSSSATSAQAITEAIAPTAGAASVQAASQKMSDAMMQLAPQQQRTRTDDTKDTPTQPSPATNVSGDASRADAQPPSHPPAVAPIRLNADVAPVRDTAHNVNLTVQLSAGQSAQANVRERAGAVDVKIVTPSQSSAQRVSSELDSMRQNFDAAGIKLGHAEVSYQQGDGRQGGERYRPPAQQQSTDRKEAFIVNEVLQ